MGNARSVRNNLGREGVTREYTFEQQPIFMNFLEPVRSTAVKNF